MAVLLLVFFASGCTSDRTMLVPRPPATVQSLGMVEGSSSGGLVLGYPPLSFIPAGLNGRYESAYQDALSKAPGATGLRNVTLKENWYCYIVATWRWVTVTGEAVK